jgi:hypothetical protein
LRSSFFLTTPAKKPRTECCCQSVAFMIAAIVVPLGSCSIFSTADCLDDEDAGDFNEAAFETAALVEAVGFDRGGTLLLATRLTLRDDLRAVFADFDFDLLVVIWLSLGINDSILCWHCHEPAEVVIAGGRDQSDLEDKYASVTPHTLLSVGKSSEL